ncbi:MAG: response regulator [Saccharospirillum sp.]
MPYCQRLEAGPVDLNASLNKRFLVVDDFSNVRKSIRSMLTALGVAHVSEAANGVEATRQVRGGRFDVVLCDYNLGKGKDGSQLLEEWRVRGWLSHETIFVMITAETSRDLVMGAIEFQPDDYLAKPFAMDTLKQRLDRWLDRQASLLEVNKALDQEDWAGVAKAARAVMELKPRYRAWAQRKFVTALLQQGQLTEAEHFLQGLLEKREQPWAQLELCRVQLQRGDDKTAERALKTLVLTQPNLIDAYDLLAQAQLHLKQPKQAQDTLAQALARSPRHIPRQRAFAELAMDNGDYYSATRAYKEIVNLAEGTMHESPDAYKNVLRSTRHHLVSLDDEALARRLHREAQAYLKRLQQAFPGDTDTELFAQAYQAYLEDPKDTSARAQKALKQLAEVAVEKMGELSTDSAAEIAEILYEKNLNAVADDLVDRLKAHHKDNAEFTGRLNALQMEPVTFEARRQAHELNTRGIACYKEKQFRQACDLFEEAQRFSPRHPGIILNLVQSTLLLAGSGDHTLERLQFCLDMVNRLAYLPDDHYQYERYQTLRKKIVDLHTRMSHEKQS